MTGVSLVFESFNMGAGYVHPFVPSLDQIIPGRGYIPENIRIVAWAYNQLKGTLSDEVAKQCLLEMANGVQKSLNLLYTNF